MATAGALGKRRMQAIARIQDICGAGFVLPTHSRYGQDVLLVVQLETIADALEANRSLALTDRALLQELERRGLASPRPKTTRKPRKRAVQKAGA